MSQLANGHGVEELAKGALTPDSVSKFRARFVDEDRFRLAQNLVSKIDPLDACLTRNAIETTNHVFNTKVDEAKPVTNQKSSGRCWLFACLNAMRIPFMKENNIDDFEFSQGYLFFWDKVERCNYFLHTVVETARREPKEAPDGRLMSFLLSSPTSDGGQWDMVANLINKWGVMPKKCFPEAFSCENSRHMNDILKSKLREYCFELRGLVEAGASDEKLNALIEVQMTEVFRIVSICLGTPPDTFTWEYYDKSKQYKKVGPVSPIKFYEDFVKPHFNVDSKICLVADPRPQNQTGVAYTVDCLGNVVGGKRTIYNNQPIDVLMDLANKSLLGGQSVWFGCDVSKHMATKQGYLDLQVHDTALVFGTKLNKKLTKADRMIYGESQMNHAMLFTGVHVDDEKNPLKWRVENSWGEDRNEKGYIVMSTDWFKEFVYEVVVDKSLCPVEILNVMDTDPIVLPAWDPMGALAR